MQCRGLCGAGGVPPLPLDLGAAAGQSQCRSAGKNHRAIKAQACHLWQLHTSGIFAGGVGKRFNDGNFLLAVLCSWESFCPFIFFPSCMEI